MELKIIFGFFLGIFIGGVITVFIFGNFSGLTGKSIIINKEGFKCDSKEIVADYAVVGKNLCSGGGSSTISTCTAKIQNNEEYPIFVYPKFICKTFNRAEYILSERKALIGGEVGEFTIDYDSEGEEWECLLKDLQATKTVEICIPE